MGIFQRISDIISANLNELTEGFENPEHMLKQAIREMEESILIATKETARAVANEKTIDRELQNNQDQRKQWGERAEQAVSSGDDDLARKALKRKHEHEKLVAALEDQKATAQEAGQSLRRQLDAMKAKLAEAKRNLATLSARHRAAEFRQKVNAVDAGMTAELDRDAFAKFDRLRDRVEQAEAEAEAFAELSGRAVEDADLEQQFDTGDDVEVDAQLAELKRRMKQ